ncbi:voltage-gated potassium channel KCNC1-like [Mytilus galloprovincialis]|uniref:voltage-gated potassium channel KCNC1-like n=1 Tax=Mytilus galloprovincialis TaxID=29158 RepID=UPI003F7BD446
MLRKLVEGQGGNSQKKFVNITTDENSNVSDNENSSKEDDIEEDEEHDDDDCIIIDVGGTKHKTRMKTLSKIHTTRLARLAERARASGKREFYFDRHPDLFPYILNFHRTGKLHVPLHVCGPLWKSELDFWKIDDKDIQKCCWVHYISYEETLEMIEHFEKDDRHTRLASQKVPDNAKFWQRYRPKLWRGLQDPYSSRASMVYAVISLLVVLVSITVFVLETLPFFGAITVHAKNSNVTSDDLRKEFDIFDDVSPYDVLLIIDNLCNLFFFTEFLIKLIAAPSKRRYFRSPMSIVELTCLIPYYIAIVIVFAHPDPIQVFELIRVLVALRVLRIFRIFIIMKHFLALKILMYTIAASTKELFLLLLVVIIGVLVFASMEYYMEIFSDQASDFDHIPLAFWWALITMTTIGYGDIVPKTALGYIVGSMCAISGVLTIALSVPAIVNNFTLYYTHAQSRQKLRERKRKFNKDKWKKFIDKSKGGSLFKAIKVLLPKKDGTSSVGQGTSSNIIPKIERRLNGNKMEDNDHPVPLPKSATNYPKIFTVSSKNNDKVTTSFKNGTAHQNGHAQKQNVLPMKEIREDSIIIENGSTTLTEII